MQEKLPVSSGWTEGLVWLGAWSSSAALLLMGLLVTYEILVRAIWGSSTLIADEMAAYLLVLLMFMGLAPTLRSGGMLRVEFLFNRFSARGRLWVELISSILALGFMIVLTYQCALFVWESYDMEYTSVNPSGIELWIPQVAIPLGAGLMVIEFLAHIARLGKAMRTDSIKEGA